jgi:hypothetical protein
MIRMANENSNGTDLFAGQPWWVKAIFFIGVPSAIALGLVWSDRVQLADTVNSNASCLQRIEQGANTHNDYVKDQFSRLSRATDETNRILLATCVNNAKGNSDAIDRCAGRR